MENTSALAGGLGDLRRFSPKPRLELSSLDAHLIAKRLAAQIWTSVVSRQMWVDGGSAGWIGESRGPR